MNKDYQEYSENICGAAAVNPTFFDMYHGPKFGKMRKCYTDGSLSGWY